MISLIERFLNASIPAHTAVSVFSPLKMSDNTENPIEANKNPLAGAAVKHSSSNQKLVSLLS